MLIAPRLVALYPFAPALGHSPRPSHALPTSRSPTAPPHLRKTEVKALCARHNLVIVAERRTSKAEGWRADILALVLLSLIKVRVSAGVFEVTLVRVYEERRSVGVLWDAAGEMRELGQTSGKVYCGAASGDSGRRRGWRARARVGTLLGSAAGRMVSLLCGTEVEARGGRSKYSHGVGCRWCGSLPRPARARWCSSFLSRDAPILMPPAVSVPLTARFLFLLCFPSPSALPGLSKIRLVDLVYVTLSSLNRHATAALPDVQCVARALKQIARWVEVDAKAEVWAQRGRGAAAGGRGHDKACRWDRGIVLRSASSPKPALSSATAASPPTISRPVLLLVGRRPTKITSTSPVPRTRKPFQNPLRLLFNPDILILLSLNGLTYSELSQTHNWRVWSATSGKLLNWDYQRVRRSILAESEKTTAQDKLKFPIEKTCFVASCAAYGWCIKKRVSIAGLLGFLVAVGLFTMAIMNAAQTLILDLVPSQGSSVTACNNLVRCALSATLVAVIQPILSALGAGWTVSREEEAEGSGGAGSIGADPTRKWACVVVSNLIQNDPSTRRLLQVRGTNIVGALITRLTDSEEGVAIEALGALRNLCINGGYDICAEIYNKSILAPSAATTRIPDPSPPFIFRCRVILVQYQIQPSLGSRSSDSNFTGRKRTNIIQPKSLLRYHGAGSSENVSLWIPGFPNDPVASASSEL
ncbi:hypothetical protein B0H14DRAFT_3499168 [Mycena olivaceomarginata]|nr:hypothetical protein B0H14DRAFT_3499168 [Mycena olivaceomarginata]